MSSITHLIHSSLLLSSDMPGFLKVCPQQVPGAQFCHRVDSNGYRDRPDRPPAIRHAADALRADRKAPTEFTGGDA
ncbi:hypothetical protein HH110_02010 [Stenotrophomonas sp. SAM-B]|uniref:hypothetical protein n=1 Tax=Stenotrophomonas sp. SAM-B TaxID=2729141 RepID=UPI0015A2A1AA|nr:hypothetical protein [Stenotrophomonas sp. SAM-B]NWF31816.1 hypothetical protein [Stenotrophomonas sp. SAM-B]